MIIMAVYKVNLLELLFMAYGIFFYGCFANSSERIMFLPCAKLVNWVTGKGELG